MKYYFGVYVDYIDANRPRIAQLTTTVDDLSCEMLADSGLITLDDCYRWRVKDDAKKLAKTHNCKFIEFGWGNYQLVKIKP